jgi:hypothetical protein
MARTRVTSVRSLTAAVVRLGTAAVVAWAGVFGPVRAADAPAPSARTVLAAELLIVWGDAQRLAAEADLPPRHRAGIERRIRGALGLLPWMLARAGDADGASALRAWQDKGLFGPAFSALLARLSERHPLDVAAFSGRPDTPATRRAAGLIHRTYCAGCHDDAGTGSPDEALPARDLFAMARAEPRRVSLARLINGVKGTAELKFENPLDTDRIAALWRYYARGR